MQTNHLTTSPTTLISTLYNSIKPPSVAKCSSCNNEQPERQLQRSQGTNYFFIPDRHVDMFVCTFCKKLDEPKCTYCWDSKPCCNHREKTHVDNYFKTIKQEIIKAAHSIVQTYKGYEKRSTDDISLLIGGQMTTQTIKKDLTIHFFNVQEKLKKDVQEQMGKNYQQIYQVYQTFEQDLKSRLNPQVSNLKAGQRKQPQTIGLSSMNASKLNMSLQDCLKWLNQLQSHRQEIRKMGQDVCDRYIDRMSVDYPKLLFNKLTDAFRLVLLPKVTFKDAMIQTMAQSVGSLKSIGSEKNLRERKQQNAGPSIVEQKVQSLQNIIKKDLQSINRLQQRVKQLQFILNIEQEKNQQLQLRVLQLQAQCGITHQNEVSLIDNIYGKKLNQNKSYDFKASLKSSRSNPTLMNQSEIIMTQERELNSGRTEESILEGNHEGKEEMKEGNSKQIAGNVKYRKKSTESKGKGMMDNSAWLEEVVNEINE